MNELAEMIFQTIFVTKIKVNGSYNIKSKIYSSLRNDSEVLIIYFCCVKMYSCVCYRDTEAYIAFFFVTLVSFPIVGYLLVVCCAIYRA